MSKVHVLDGNGGSYRVIVHVAMPTGTNSVGNSWKDVLIAGGVAGGSSVMVVGTGAGMISSSENAQIASGDVLEFQTNINAKPDGSALTVDEIDAIIDAFTAERFRSLQARFRFFGFTRN